MKRVQVTVGQIAEMTTFLCRLTPEEYQARRGLLRRVTDPKQALDVKLLYPFTDQRPVEWGWQGVEREGAPCDEPIDIAKLELVPFHNPDEEYVSGEEMMRRAGDGKKYPGCQAMGQHAAEHLLSRADKLPKEWANDQGPVLLFIDTILVDGGGYRDVPCLFCYGGGWRLGWCWLSSGFLRCCRFVRLSK